MRLISHRGNLYGKSMWENTKSKIEEVIHEGFDVEIDIWKVGDAVFLGHDCPREEVTLEWLRDNKDFLWLHAKNLCALYFFARRSSFNVFWHENDRFTLTSKGFIWTNIGQPCTEDSVLVALNTRDLDVLPSDIFGICSDFVGKLRKTLC